MKIFNGMYPQGYKYVEERIKLLPEKPDPV
jgi:hypothetical protein